MSQNILTGFILKDISSISDVEMIIYQMRTVINRRASIAYSKLVCWQAERIFDEIVLGQYVCPPNKTILDIAAEEVRRRVICAEKKGHKTEFNLSAGIQVLIGKLNGQPTIYLKTTFPNDIYSKHLRKIKELLPYTINEDDINGKSEKREFWESIREKYTTDIPLVSALISYDEVSFNPENFKFRSPSERAHDIATEKIMNHLLSSYGCNQEIPPNKLMEYTLQAFSRLTNPDIIDMIHREEELLKNMLPVIEVDSIRNPGGLTKKTE